MAVVSRRTVVVLTVLFLLPALASWSPSTAHAQDWSWPEKAENLRELPEDFPPERLRAVMSGFSRSLGVRCSHCHVGEEGKPLSTYDFPSDDNPNKERAREMLRMLGSINEHLKNIEPSGMERVNMWCHTCHQGRARPMTLQEELGEAYRSAAARDTPGDASAAVARYRELQERYADRGAYDFSGASLNAFGYRLLGQGDVAGALAIFRLATREHPDSANAWDSLAEAYAAAGDPERAETFYRRSLELDPDNDNAVTKLRELAAREAEGGPTPATGSGG